MNSEKSKGAGGAVEKVTDPFSLPAIIFYLQCDSYLRS